MLKLNDYSYIWNYFNFKNYTIKGYKQRYYMVTLRNVCYKLKIKSYQFINYFQLIIVLNYITY